MLSIFKKRYVPEAQEVAQESPWKRLVREVRALVNSKIEEPTSAEIFATPYIELKNVWNAVPETESSESLDLTFRPALGRINMSREDHVIAAQELEAEATALQAKVRSGALDLIHGTGEVIDLGTYRAKITQGKENTARTDKLTPEDEWTLGANEIIQKFHNRKAA